MHVESAALGPIARYLYQSSGMAQLALLRELRTMLDLHPMAETKDGKTALQTG